MKKKITRRRLLQAGSGLAVGGILSPAHAVPGKPSVYEALGLKHVINATGTVTNLGGSVMPPEVVAAWAEASRHFVNLVELHDRVGERIAKLVGVEAALVTTGASGALLLATAAAVTGNDAKSIARLPEILGPKTEVILQKSHHSCYDNQMTNVGVKLIEVETLDEAQRAINARTALMFFMNKEEPAGKIDKRAWVALAKKHRVPTLLDAAADVPPLERFASFNQMGFDLVAISGGKALRGPNDTGLLLGSKTLIDAAKLNANPHCGTIGRMMKVGKEDMIALLAAVERFVKMDHQAERREHERKIGVIEKQLAGIATVTTERIVPAISNVVPHLIVEWNEAQLKVTREQVKRELATGDPPIRIDRVSGTGTKGILIAVLTLQAGEEQTVAERLSAILRQARP